MLLLLLLLLVVLGLPVKEEGGVGGACVGRCFIRTLLLLGGGEVVGRGGE